MADALLEQLADAVTAAGSRFLTASTFDDVLDDVVGDASAIAVSPSLAGCAPRLVELLGALDVRVIVTTAKGPVSDAVDVDVGVVKGELAVAETGSVLVDEHHLADRSTSMLTRRSVQIVPSTRIVADLDEVARWLANRPGEAGFASLITGPSRSADIERSLTIGVQGPTFVDVVVLAEAAW